MRRSRAIHHTQLKRIDPLRQIKAVIVNLSGAIRDIGLAHLSHGRKGPKTRHGRGPFALKRVRNVAGSDPVILRQFLSGAGNQQIITAGVSQ